MDKVRANGGSAYPSPGVVLPAGLDGPRIPMPIGAHDGMSVLDAAAIAALPECIRWCNHSSYGEAVKMAVTYAQALVAALQAIQS